MLDLVESLHNRTKTVLVISISVCTNSTVSIATSRKYLVYLEFLVNSVFIKKNT